MFAHQGPEALLVVNGDDPVADALAAAAPGRVVRFGPARRRRAGTACARARWSARPAWWRRCPSRARRTTSPTRWPPPPRPTDLGADAAAVADGPRPASPASRTGCSWWGSAPACASTTTRRPPTRTPPSARSPASTTSCSSRAVATRRSTSAACARTRAGSARWSRSVRPRTRSRPRSPARSRWSRAGSMHEAVRAAVGARPRRRRRCCSRPRARRSTGTTSYAARGDDFAREVELLRGGAASVRQRRTRMTAFTSHVRAHRHRAARHDHAPRPRRRGRRPRSCSSPRSRCSTSSAS